MVVVARPDPVGGAAWPRRRPADDGVTARARRLEAIERENPEECPMQRVAMRRARFEGGDVVGGQDWRVRIGAARLLEREEPLNVVVDLLEVPIVPRQDVFEGSPRVVCSCSTVKTQDRGVGHGWGPGLT